MGLSGRKEKQRIGHDPRNLSWADDAARFGSNYLSKFGWDASKGLGAEGDGRTSHLKVAQKLDMLGIGAAHTKDPNGIAWKQNKDFEKLLARLNGGSDAVPTAPVAGFHAATEPAVAPVAAETMDVDEQDEGGKKKKKEKKDKDGKKEKKDKKRKRGDNEDEEEDTHKKAKTVEPTPTPTPSSAETTDSAPGGELYYRRAYVPQHRAHRARAIAAKSIASKSTAHVNEILGVTSEPSTSASTSALATPNDQGKLTIISELEKITTSTKSVADYFKERLLAKANAKSGSSTPQTPLDSSIVAIKEEEEEDKPRGGLGFSGLGFGVKQEERSSVETDTLKMGLSKFSSLMSSTFLSSAMSFSPATQLDSSPSEETDVKLEESDRKEQKRLRKEEKAKKKAAKAKKKAGKAEAAAAAESSSLEVEQKKEKKSKKKKDKKDKSS